MSWFTGLQVSHYYLSPHLELESVVKTYPS